MSAAAGWAIDLGTTNTGVARWDPASGGPRLCELPAICRLPGGDDHLEAPKLCPSATHLVSDDSLAARLGRWPFFAGRTFWGRWAEIGRRALERNEGRSAPAFAPSFKRFLGDSPLRTLARLGGKSYAARDVARIFCRELLREVEQTTGERIRQLTLTAPVDAYESYRAELLQIFRSLGVRRIRFVDEPVAAAIGYGLGLKQARRVLVVDFGGGTLDLAVVDLTAKGVQQGTCQVLAKEGRGVGGDLVDRWLCDEVCRRLDYVLAPEADDDNVQFWHRMLVAEACRVKEGLFFKERETFYLTPPEDLRRFEARLRGDAPVLEVGREDLVALLEAHGLYRTLAECTEGLDAQLRALGHDPEGIEEVLMVGGSTLLPGVYPLFEERFGRGRVRAWQPFEAVAYGAAAFSADRFTQSDFIVHDYAFVTYDRASHKPEHTIVIPRGTRFPTPSDLWRERLVPTCSLGEPETVFKLVICEVGRSASGQRRFSWDAHGDLKKLGGADGGDREPLVVPLNESNPTLGQLDPPHVPSDRAPRLEIAFGVDEDRWLKATVLDLKTRKHLMRDEPVVRLL